MMSPFASSRTTSGSRAPHPLLSRSRSRRRTTRPNRPPRGPRHQIPSSAATSISRSSMVHTPTPATATSRFAPRKAYWMRAHPSSATFPPCIQGESSILPRCTAAGHAPDCGCRISASASQQEPLTTPAGGKTGRTMVESLLLGSPRVRCSHEDTAATRHRLCTKKWQRRGSLLNASSRMMEEYLGVG